MATYIIGSIVIGYGLYMLATKAKTGGCEDCGGCMKPSSCSGNAKGGK